MRLPIGRWSTDPSVAALPTLNASCRYRCTVERLPPHRLRDGATACCPSWCRTIASRRGSGSRVVPKPRPSGEPWTKEPCRLFCSRCGHPNRDDARVCVECGHPLHEDVTVTLPAIEPEEEGSEEFPFPDDALHAGQALLLVKRGPNAGSTFLLEGDETTMGRDTDSAVFLDDVTVSRKHAVVERHDDEWFVVD